jgi:hypothetical protein
MRRFNEWLAIKITQGVGSMWCAYIFCLLALLGLPTALHPGGEGLIAWIAQTFLQLILLSIILVGQGIQGRSVEARDSETHDTVMAELLLLRELVADLTPPPTGGSSSIQDCIDHGTCD